MRIKRNIRSNSLVSEQSEQDTIRSKQWKSALMYLTIKRGLRQLASAMHMLKRSLCELVSICKRLLFRLLPSRFEIERGKFDNVSYIPLAVAISKK